MKKRIIKVLDLSNGEILHEQDATLFDELKCVNVVQDLEIEYQDNRNIEVIDELIEIVEEIKEGSLVLPVILERTNEKKDLSVCLTFSTNKPSNEKYLQIRELKNQVGVLLFKTTETVNDEDHKILDSIEPTYTNKSPSQKLRAVYYRIWEIKPEGHNKFETFYNWKMEEGRQNLLRKLEDYKLASGV